MEKPDDYDIPMEEPEWKKENTPPPKPVSETPENGNPWANQVYPREALECIAPPPLPDHSSQDLKEPVRPQTTRDLEEGPWMSAVDFLKENEGGKGRKLYNNLIYNSTKYMYAWVRSTYELIGVHENYTGDLVNLAERHYKDLEAAVEAANEYLRDNTLFNLDSQDILVIPQEEEVLKDMARLLMDEAEGVAKEIIHFIAEGIASMPKKT